MAKQPRRRSHLGLWISLLVTLLFFLVAFGAFFLVTSSPVNRSHQTQSLEPVQVTLPATAPPASTATKSVIPSH